MRTQLFACLVILCLPNFTSAGERPYNVDLAPGFETSVSLEDIERTTYEVLSRPLEVAIGADGGSAVAPLPKIHRIVGCRGADLSRIDPRLGETELDFVWVVLARGTFAIPHFGELRDAEGFFLVHPKSGLFIRTGIFDVYGEAAKQTIPSKP